MKRKFYSLIMNPKFYVMIVFIAFVPTAVSAQIASGGTFTLEKSAIAAGGGTSANGAFSITGTIGQAAAGTTSINAPLVQTAGFWTPEQFAPTSAVAAVGGRVITADGAGIRSVVVTLTGPSGIMRTVITGSFGYYRFTDVAVGETYILSVSAKKYIFADPTRVVSVQEELTDLNFVADHR